MAVAAAGPAGRIAEGAPPWTAAKQSTKGKKKVSGHDPLPSKSR